MSELKFKFKMPDDESLAEYISVKGEKGDRGDPTKLSQLENDAGFITASTNALTNYYSKTATDDLLAEKVDPSDLDDYYDKSEIDSLQEDQDLVINLKPYYFDSVAGLKTADVKEGDCVITQGYYAYGDGGSGKYTIVNDSTLNDDGGSVHALANGLKAVLMMDGKITVKQFGAKGDGATDDTARLQQAINIAHSNRQLLFFPKAIYLIAGSLTIYSNMTIDGGGSTLKGEFNGALMTSSIVSRIEIKNLTFIGAGNDAYTDNIGMSIVSYYSNFHDLAFRSLYKGISLRTDGADGTLVENRIGTCTFTACNQSLDLGKANNNKLTDGFLNNIIINSKDSALPAILLGSASGWVIDGVHIYGNCRRGLYALNGFHTQMNNLYIERASEELVFLAAIQTDVNINNITGTITSASGIGIRLSRSSYHPFGNAAKANLNNIHLNVQSAATSSVGISGTDVDLNISNYSHLSESDTFTPVSTNNTNTLSYQPDTYIAKGKLTDRTNSLSYKSSLVSIAYKARVEAGGDKTITIPIDKKLDSYDIIRFKVAILTKANWNGTIRINYTATVILVNKNNAKSVTVLEENGTSGGFTTTPTYSYDPDIGALTLSYTPSSSDGYGCIFVDII